MPAREARQVEVPWLLAAVAAWSWRVIAVAAAFTVLVVVLIRLYVVVVPVVLALFLAAVLDHPVAYLRRRGLPDVVAAALVFLGSLALLVGLVAWIGDSVAREFEDVGEQVRQGTADIKEWLAGEPFNLSRARIDEIEADIRNAFRTAGGGVSADRVAKGARTGAEVLGGLVLMLFTLFFVLKDGHRMATWFHERVPREHKDDAVEVARRGRSVMRQYVIATALTGFIDAVLIAVALLLIGVPLVVPLAVLTFFGGFFPIVGATMAGFVATLVALVNGGFGDALLVAAATIAIQQIEGNLLQPLILERAVKLHPLVTVWAVAAGIVVGGLLGAFLSVPLVAIAVQTGSYYRGRLESA